MQSLFYKFTECLPYILIPFISGFIGWITNVLALKMTFYPIEYKGIKPIGWQGIIPSKAEKMASISVELMANKLIDIKEIFSRVDSKETAKLLDPIMSKITIKIIDESMNLQASFLWKVMTKLLKQKIYNKAINNLSDTTTKIMEDIKENINELLDLKHLAVTVLVNNKALLNKIFLNVGDKEFRFIEHSGFYFGFLFGIIQMIIYFYFNPWWVLPVTGIFVGYMTNFLALKMIFRPVKPINILGYKFQGLFFKRQKEVAVEYSKIVSDKVVTTENLFNHIFKGTDTTRINKIMHKHISNQIDNIAPNFQRIFKLIFGKEKLDNTKNGAISRFKEELPHEIPVIFNYANKAIDLKNTMQSKMTALPPKDFESFLHPVFKEEEFKLIIVGALLGGFAGLSQYFLFF